MDVLTLLNARVDGKQVLLSAPCAVHAVHILSHLATRGVDDIKDRALVALAHIFRYKLGNYDMSGYFWVLQFLEGCCSRIFQIL